MSDSTEPDRPNDSLDEVERQMAIELVIDSMLAEGRLAPSRCEQAIREIEARMDRAGFGDEDDFDDDALTSLVRNIGPGNPPGQAGAAVKPEEPYFE